MNTRARYSLVVAAVAVIVTGFASGQSLNGLPVFVDGAQWFIYGGPDDIGNLRAATTENALATWAGACMAVTSESRRLNGWPELVIAAEPSWLKANASFAYYAAGYADGTCSAVDISRRYEAVIAPLYKMLERVGGEDLLTNLTHMTGVWGAQQRARFQSAYGITNLTALNATERARVFTDAYTLGLRDGYQAKFREETTAGTLRRLTDADLVALSIASDELPVLAASTLHAPCDNATKGQRANMSAPELRRCAAVAEARTELLALTRRQGFAVVSAELNATGANVAANYTHLFPGLVWKVLQLDVNIAGPTSFGSPAPDYGYAIAAAPGAVLTVLSVPTYANVTASVMGGAGAIPNATAMAESISQTAPFVDRTFAYLLAGAAQETDLTTFGPASPASGVITLAVRSAVSTANGTRPQHIRDISVLRFEEVLGDLDTNPVAPTRIELHANTNATNNSRPRTLILDGNSGAPFDTSSWQTPSSAVDAGTGFTTLGQLRSAWRNGVQRRLAAEIDTRDDDDDAGHDWLLQMLLRDVTTADQVSGLQPSAGFALAPRFDLAPFGEGSAMPPLSWYSNFTPGAHVANVSNVSIASENPFDAVVWLTPTLRGLVASVAAPIDTLASTWAGRADVDVVMQYGPESNSSRYPRTQWSIDPAGPSAWQARLPAIYNTLFAPLTSWMSSALPTSGGFKFQLRRFTLPLTPASEYRVGALEFGATWVVIVVTALGGPAVFVLVAFAMRSGASAEAIGRGAEATSRHRHSGSESDSGVELTRPPPPPPPHREGHHHDGAAAALLPVGPRSPVPAAAAGGSGGGYGATDSDVDMQQPAMNTHSAQGDTAAKSTSRRRKGHKK